MKLSAKAAQLNDLIDTKFTRIRILIEKGDFSMQDVRIVI